MVVMASGIARGGVMHNSDDDDDNNGIAQDGGHTPNNRLTEMQPRFTVYFLDIGHPCYDQLTPVKTRYLLTSIM